MSSFRLHFAAVSAASLLSVFSGDNQPEVQHTSRSFILSNICRFRPYLQWYWCFSHLTSLHDDHVAAIHQRKLVSIKIGKLSGYMMFVQIFMIVGQ
jgi:hypothetical protein